MTTPKPAKVTPTEEQREWARGCVDAYRVSGTIEDVIAESLVTRDRDVRRKALEEAIRAVHEWEGDESTDLAIDEMLRELIDRDPDHAD